jgi:hypothetical protein
MVPTINKPFGSEKVTYRNWLSYPSLTDTFFKQISINEIGEANDMHA